LSQTRIIAPSYVADGELDGELDTEAEGELDGVAEGEAEAAVPTLIV